MSPRTRNALLTLGIVALAFNLRPAAVSIGPVLDDIRHGLGMSGSEAGVLTSLPIIAFAVFGGLAPRLARWLGPHRLTLVALLCVVVGLFSRSRVDGVVAFLALSLLALAGMATANVLIPSLIKQHFPGRVGTMTAAYTTSLAVGLTSASVLTVPVGAALDGWRSGLMVWSLTAAVAVLPWVALVREDRAPEEEEEPATPIRLADVARTRLGWMMALFFGLQSVQAYSIFGWFADIYHDAGFSSGTAGLLLGVTTAVSIPTSFVVPALAGRLRHVTWLVVGFFGCYVVGYLGLAVAPAEGALVWAVLVGLGTATFPLVLTLIGLRARTAPGTAALSGFTQSVGYLIAAVGPFLVGVLHDLSDGWTVPLLALAALTVPLLVSGLAISRTVYLEDQLRPRQPSQP
ncbi:MFS transporter [Nocardioides sp. InS609-2]|uniref:CynX/NimT family MFS transporter n=1 Tax=Nocardioides sp. InS609-2 TaxID=2760705 RepID=UPI0020C0E949|nr:MFS transporter [Nocardioides sp. InS609-2]